MAPDTAADQLRARMARPDVQYGGTGRTRATKDDRRLAALQSAQDAGIIFAVQRVGKTRFSVGVGAATVEFTGRQVDAFLYGVRLGQVSADKPFARTT